METIKIKVWHRELKQVWWFDVLWGNKWHAGSGYIGMLPEGQERRYIGHGDNRQDVDPMDCNLISIVCENTGQEIINIGEDEKKMQEEYFKSIGL